MAKHPTFTPFIGSLWTESLSNDKLILNELKRLTLERHLKPSKTDLTISGKNKRLVLQHQTGQAIFVWEKQLISRRKYGVRCVLFVNNSKTDSVGLLEEAMKLARLCWIDYPFFVEVDSKLHPKNAEKVFVKCEWKRVATMANVKIFTSNFGALATRERDLNRINFGKSS